MDGGDHRDLQSLVTQVVGDGPGPRIEPELAELLAQREDHVLHDGRGLVGRCLRASMVRHEGHRTAGSVEGPVASNPRLGATRGCRHIAHRAAFDQQDPDRVEARSMVMTPMSPAHPMVQGSVGRTVVSLLIPMPMVIAIGDTDPQNP